MRIVYIVERVIEIIAFKSQLTGITLKEMSEEDSMKANSLWPNSHEGTEFLLKRLTAWNPNIGAYDKDENLIAWCFRYIYIQLNVKCQIFV